MKFFRLMLLCGCAALMGCGHSHNHNDAHGHGHAEEAETHEHEDGLITLTHAQAKAAELATETLATSDFEECLRVSGQVMTAQGDEQALTARSSGILSFVRDHLSEGVAVRQGEILARISAAQMEGGDAIAQQTQALSAARAALVRAERLAQDTLISQKELERIRTEYEQARLAAGISASAKGGSAVTCPLTGFLRSVLVREGEYVEAGRTIATVTKNCNLQLRAEVPEKYYRRIGDIRSAQFEMSYGGGVHHIDSLHGHLVSVGQSASESSAYIPVTFEFVNDGCIVAGSFADIWLLTHRRPGVLSVPHEAVTEEQGVHYIYIALPHHHHGKKGDAHDELEFEKREVRLGASNGTRVEILRGAKAGERVVVRGVTQVKLAANSGSIPEAHSHNH